MFTITANRTKSDKKRVVVRESITLPTALELARLKNRLVANSLEFDETTQFQLKKDSEL